VQARLRLSCARSLVRVLVMSGAGSARGLQKVVLKHPKALRNPACSLGETLRNCGSLVVLKTARQSRWNVDTKNAKLSVLEDGQERENFAENSEVWQGNEIDIRESWVTGPFTG
jgi:hypothetical protein